jgi:transcriptional regulator with XRE-family HTH domain
MQRYTNLLTELTRKGLSQKDLSIKLGIRPETLSKKILMRTDFTFSEVKRIRDLINPEYKIEYLFAIEEA